jgi:hypothetical protein
MHSTFVHTNIGYDINNNGNVTHPCAGTVRPNIDYDIVDNGDIANVFSRFVNTKAYPFQGQCIYLYDIRGYMAAAPMACPFITTQGYYFICFQDVTTPYFVDFDSRLCRPYTASGWSNIAHPHYTRSSNVEILNKCASMYYTNTSCSNIVNMSFLRDLSSLYVIEIGSIYYVTLYRVIFVLPGSATVLMSPRSARVITRRSVLSAVI